MSKTVVTSQELDDTGWVTIPLTGMVEYASGDAPRVRRIGSIVQITGHMKPTTTSTSATFGTLDAQFRPAVTSRFVFVQQGSSNERWSLSVYPSGNLVFERYSGTITTSIWLPFSAMYFIN